MVRKPRTGYGVNPTRAAQRANPTATQNQRRKQLYGKQLAPGTHTGGKSDIELAAQAKVKGIQAKKDITRRAVTATQQSRQPGSFEKIQGLLAQAGLSMADFQEHDKGFNERVKREQEAQIEQPALTPAEIPEAGMPFDEAFPEKESGFLDWMETVADKPGLFEIENKTPEDYVKDPWGLRLETGHFAQGALLGETSGMAPGAGAFKKGTDVADKILKNRQNMVKFAKIGLSKFQKPTKVVDAAAGQLVKDKVFIKDLAKRTGLKVKSTKGLVGRQITLAEGRAYANSQINTKTGGLLKNYLMKYVKAATNPYMVLGFLTTVGFGSLYWAKDQIADAEMSGGILVSRAMDYDDREGARILIAAGREAANITAETPIKGFGEATAAKIDLLLKGYDIFEKELDKRDRNESVWQKETAGFAERRAEDVETGEQIVASDKDRARSKDINSRKIKGEYVSPEEEEWYRGYIALE